MTKFLNDLTGAVYDTFSSLIKGLAHFMLGMIIVAIPMYMFVVLVNLFTQYLL